MEDQVNRARDQRDAARDEVARLKRALRDIASADPLPSPLQAFEFCRTVAANALK